jgi:hypothetical protein
MPKKRSSGDRGARIAGCFPLDGYYKAMPEADELKQVKRDL